MNCRNTPRPVSPVPRPHFLMALNALALVLTAIWLRGHSLGNIPGINGDEAWYGVQAWRMFHGGTIDWHTPTGNPLNPLFVGPLALLHLWFTPSFVLLRAVAFAGGLAALAINWLLCRWVFDRRTAAVSTVILAILPINIAYSRFAWDASQSLATTLPVMYLALAAVRYADRFGRWIAASLLALAIAVWVHPTNLFAGTAIAAACVAHYLAICKRNCSKRNRHPEGSEGSRAEVQATRSFAALRMTLTSWGLVFIVLTVLITVAWLLAARPTHGLLARHVAERFDDVRQLDRTTNLPSVFLLYPRLFTGGTVYRYLVGSHSWFEWPSPADSDGWGLDVGLFCLAILGSGWLLWRQPRSQTDRVLLAAWGLELAAFLLVAGPRAMAPGSERFAICLIAPAVLLMASGATYAWDAASSRWRIVLAAATLLAWPLLADFQLNYFHFIEQTGGQAHLTFRTAAVEPKQAALQSIVEDAQRTTGDGQNGDYPNFRVGENGTVPFNAAGPQHGPPTWIVSSEWWNRWPIRYLAIDDSTVHVAEPNELDAADEYRQAQANGRVWFVEFCDSAAQHHLESQWAGQNASSWQIPDYAGRPLLNVFRPKERQRGQFHFR